MAESKRGTQDQRAKEPRSEREPVVAPGQTSVDATRENEERNAAMAANQRTSDEKRGGMTAGDGVVVQNAEQQEADSVPEHSGEPPIPLAPGNFDNRAFSVDEVVPPSPRMILPPIPERQEAPMNTRTVEDEDINSVGYKCLVPSAQVNVETLILRPGDQVVGALDVYPCDDVSNEARITLLPGSYVPDEARAFFPANYMVESKRLALSGDARKVGSLRGK